MTVSPDFILLSEERLDADQFVGALCTLVFVRVKYCFIMLFVPI